MGYLTFVAGGSEAVVVVLASLADPISLSFLSLLFPLLFGLFLHLFFGRRQGHVLWLTLGVIV